ncbi:MAG: hypothetical protein HGA59_08690 [Chlorobiaceae bacterium]|jgi:hypothetical protein|nr:hypothetical protein [Chlorobiaceae bacterium]
MLAMMIRILWLEAVKAAWVSYIKKINRVITPQTMDSYLSQQINMGLTLEEFAEMVFIEGFVAGENYTKALMNGNGKREPSIN